MREDGRPTTPGSDILTHLTATARRAGEALESMVGGPLEQRYKSPGELVTAADEAAHKIFVAELGARFPGLPLVLEEGAVSEVPPGPFLVGDELDGTVPFARGMAEWGLTLARIDGRPTHGVIFLPRWRILVTAERGKGCRINGAPVRLGRAGRLADAVWGTEINPRLGGEQLRRWVGRLSRRTLSTRCLAVATAAIAELLLGRTALYVNCRGGKIWDFAAGVLAVEEAGGVATRIDGTPIGWDLIELDVLLAASRAVAEEVRAIVDR